MQLISRQLRALKASQSGKNLLATTAWSATGETLSRGLLLISMVFVARQLGAESYGQFGLIRSTVNVFMTVGGMGLGLTANRFVAQHRDKDKKYSGDLLGASYLLALCSGLVVGAVIFAISDYLAVDVLRAPELIVGLRISSLLLLLGALNGAQIGMLQGLGAYRTLAAGSLGQGIIALVSLVAGARYFGLNGALTGLLIYSVAGFVIMQVLIVRETRRQAIMIRYARWSASLPTFWKFSFPVMLSGIAIAPVKWLAETILARRMGFAQLGIFHASMTTATIILALVSTMNAPLISFAANRADGSRTSKATWITLFGPWYMYLALALPLVLMPQLPALAFGEKYAGGAFYIATLLLLLYCGLMTYYQGINRLMALNGSMWFGFATNLFEGLTLLIGFYLLAGHGAPGLGLAYVTSYAVRILISVPYLTGKGLIATRVLFDKYFLITLTALAMLIVLQIMRLA